MTATEENIGDTADVGEDLYHALGPALEVAEKAAKKPLRPWRGWREWREGLAARIKIAIMAYDGIQFMAESKFTLHEIAAPLEQVIEMLEHGENIDEVLIALGAPAMLMVSPDRESVDRAIAEYRAMLRSLNKVADNLPLAPAKRRGRPKANDLHQLVELLADVWEDFTSQEFTQRWHKEKGEWKPISAAVQFVHAVISVVDPKRLKSVPEVTEQVVTRRRATSEK